MIEIIDCKPLSEATEEELADLRRNGWIPENERRKPTPFQRTESKVRATGNKWAMENFIAAHY